MDLITLSSVFGHSFTPFGIIFFFIAALGITGIILVVRLRKSSLPLPPGPTRLPFIGNLHQAPKEYPWRVFQNWGKKYGPIFKLQFAQNTIIMLTNHETAHELLDRRSSIYSSRPRVVMAAECLGQGMLTLLMPYGPRWRAHQRLQMSSLNIRASQTYCQLQELESTQLVFDMLSTNDFTAGFRRYSAGLVFALAYGRRLEHNDCPDLKQLDIIMENTLDCLIPGWLVDIIPALNYLPKSLAPWKRYAEKLRNFESQVYLRNFTSALSSRSWNWSKQVHSMARGQMTPLEMAYNVGIVWEVSTDTTTIALEVFILAAVLHPAVAKKAQAQLDHVVGPSRLPGFFDKEHLPYVFAIVQEVLRWRPVAAGGVPHAVTEDDEYMGFRIPKGATILANQWAICHDEMVFPEPETFAPERWIQNPDLPVAAFGHGRRTCFGQHIAKNSLFIIIARLLWAFDIECATEVINGEKTRLVPDPLAMTQGFNSKPMPFKAMFTPRSPNAEDIIKQTWGNAEKDVDIVLNRVALEQSVQKGKTYG